jgi:hypothetical protein
MMGTQLKHRHFLRDVGNGMGEDSWRLKRLTLSDVRLMGVDLVCCGGDLIDALQPKYNGIERDMSHQ